MYPQGEYLPTVWSSYRPQNEHKLFTHIALTDWFSGAFAKLRIVIFSFGRSQWPRGRRRSYTAARLLRSWVRIPPEIWMFFCCECCVLSGRGLYDGLITRPEESYRLWCVVVCDLETSRMRRAWPALGRSATGGGLISFIVPVYPLVRQHGATQISLEVFSWNFIFGEFRKFVEKIQVSLTADKNDGYFNEDACALIVISLWILLIMRNVSGKSCIEHTNTHFKFNDSFCGV